MSLRCPACGTRLGSFQVMKFIRLATIYCTGCNSPLRLDNRGRTALWLPIIVSFLLILVFFKEYDFDYTAPILLIAGFVAGAVSGNRFGKVDIPDREESE